MAKRLSGKEERKILRSVTEKLERARLKKEEKLKLKKEKGIKALTGLFTKPKKGIKKERRALGKRAAGVKRLLGGIQTVGKKIGRGRPSGTFKYGIPIQQYKRLQSRKRALYDVYKRNQLMELQRRGLRPEQIRELQLRRTIQEKGIVQVQEPSGPIETPASVMHPVDDDLEFRKFRADKTISPNTQMMLRRLRKTQLKSERDDVDMQRRLKERKMVEGAGSILDTPYIFNKHQFNATGVEESNILNAPNVFKESPDNPHILKTNRPNILQTAEGGNSLNFF